MGLALALSLLSQGAPLARHRRRLKPGDVEPCGNGHASDHAHDLDPGVLGEGVFGPSHGPSECDCGWAEPEGACCGDGDGTACWTECCRTQKGLAASPPPQDTAIKEANDQLEQCVANQRELQAYSEQLRAQLLAVNKALLASEARVAELQAELTDQTQPTPTPTHTPTPTPKTAGSPAPSLEAAQSPAPSPEAAGSPAPSPETEGSPVPSPEAAGSPAPSPGAASQQAEGSPAASPEAAQQASASSGASPEAAQQAAASPAPSPAAGSQQAEGSPSPSPAPTAVPLPQPQPPTPSPHAPTELHVDSSEEDTDVLDVVLDNWL